MPANNDKKGKTASSKSKDVNDPDAGFETANVDVSGTYYVL